MVQFYTRKYYFEFSSFRKTVKPNRDTGCWTSTAKKINQNNFFKFFIFAVGMGGFERKLRTIFFWKMSETFLKKVQKIAAKIFFWFNKKFEQKQYIITRPNCALNRRTISCLYVPGLHRQTFKDVPKSKWIPLTKLPSIPRTNTCNVNFVGTFAVPRVAQQANMASCLRFRNSWWIPQNVSEISMCKRIPQTKWIQIFIYYLSCIWTIQN